jgi:hypothetical protein
MKWVSNSITFMWVPWGYGGGPPRTIGTHMAKKSGPISIRAATRAKVFGSSNHWSLAPFPNGGDGRIVDVNLEIQGSPKSGFNLVQSPEGYFTADTHCPTLEDAKADAQEMFGVLPTDWKQS